MKTNKLITIFTLGLFAFMTLGSTAQTNLLLNGGFEGAFGANNLPESWVNFTPQSAVNLSLVTTNPYEGLKSLSISFDPATNNDGLVTQTITGIETGKKYDVSYWYKYSEIVVGSTGGSALQWLSASNEDVSPVDADLEFFFGQEAPTLSAGVFLPIAFTVTAPATATQLFIAITTLGPTRNFIVDDVKIIKQPELSSNEFSVAKKLNIYTNDNTVYVATQGGEQVSLYNLLGQKVASTIANKNVTSFDNLTKNQILVVIVDNKSEKVIVQ